MFTCTTCQHILTKKKRKIKRDDAVKVGIGILCCLDYRWPIDFLSDWHLASGYGGHAGKKKSACITLIYFSLDMFLTALFGH